MTVSNYLTEKFSRRYAKLRHIAFRPILLRIFFLFDGKAIIRNQNPIWLDELSEPEPDIVLAALRDDEYVNSHPTPEEIFAIVEVSDLTLEFDRNTKGKAYARAGIRQYLVLNVPDKTLEDYREPSADGFQSKQTLRAGQKFNLVAFPEIYLEVNDFLPAEKN
jgi:Uma2 family endonuclease